MPSSTIPTGRLEARLNPETVLVFDLEGDAERRCRELIEAHVEATGSVVGTRLLAAWETERAHFVHLRGEEVVKRERIHLQAANETRTA